MVQPEWENRGVRDFFLARDFGLELLDGGVLGILADFGFSSILEESVCVFKDFSLPAVKEGGRDAKLIADGGDGHTFEQVPLECGELVVGGEMPTFAVHDEPSVQVRPNPNGAIFQIRLRQNRSIIASPV